MDAGVGVTSRIHLRDRTGRFAALIDEAAQAAVDQASRDGVALAKEFAPRGRTGLLAAGIHTITRGKHLGGFATAGVREAMPQETGARAHVIESHEGPFGALANKEDGFYSSHAVMHPGNPAVHYMKRAADIVNRQLLNIMKRKMP